MPDKKSNGGGGGAKIGDMVLYQPTRHDWLRGGGAQVPGIVHWVDEDSENGTANLIVFPTADGRDHILGAVYGDGDGQYMKQGEESKTAKAIKQAREDQKKADEARAKKDEEDAKKAQEEAKQKSPGGFPTAQTQLDADQHRAQMQYKYPQPPQE